MRIFPTLISAVCRAARAVIATALALTALAAVARAQAPAPPPGPPPQTRPSVPTLPGAPSPLVSVPGAVATPLATPVAIPTALPTPAARLFNCSCFTTVSGTQWSGTVTAPSYAAARSAASGACFNYVTSSPQSPFIQPGQSPGLGNGNSAAANAASLRHVGQPGPAARHRRIDLTFQCVEKFAGAHRANVVQRLRLQLTPPGRYSMSSLAAGGCEL